MVETTYDMDEDSTVKTDNISASVVHGEISAIQMKFPQKGGKRQKSR
jgi:hypothetical protein